MMARAAGAAILMLATVSPATGQNAAEREAAAGREAFLRTAEVVGGEVVGVGITLPERLELELDGLRRSALFKSATLAYPAPIRVGGETQEGLRDSWKYEVAAYELDKLLGLGMVPVTVARTIGDREGALIDWVDEVLPEFGASPAGFQRAAWEDQVARIWLFDYLAYNIDRTPENLLLTPGFGVALIDHSRAFQRFLVPMRPLSRFPRAVIDRLRSMTEGTLRAPLEPWLEADELEALVERRRRVLQRVDALLASKPETDVLF